MRSRQRCAGDTGHGWGLRSVYRQICAWTRGSAKGGADAPLRRIRGCISLARRCAGGTFTTDSPFAPRPARKAADVTFDSRARRALLGRRPSPGPASGRCRRARSPARRLRSLRAFLRRSSEANDTATTLINRNSVWGPAESLITLNARAKVMNTPIDSRAQRFVRRRSAKALAERGPGWLFTKPTSASSVAYYLGDARRASVPKKNKKKTKKKSPARFPHCGRRGRGSRFFVRAESRRVSPSAIDYASTHGRGDYSRISSQRHISMTMAGLRRWPALGRGVQPVLRGRPHAKVDLRSGTELADRVAGG